MPENQDCYHRRPALWWVGLVAWGAMMLFIMVSPLAQAADSQPMDVDEWGIGGGERFLSEQNVDATDTDGDGISDTDEGNGPSVGTYNGIAYRDPNLCSLLIKEGEKKDHRITMKIDKGVFRDVHIVSENDPNRPKREITDPEFPYGFISFRIEGLDDEGEDEVTLKIFFHNMLVSPHARLCRYYDKQWLAQIGYDIGDGDYWKYDTANLPKQNYKQSITVTLRDNNPAHDSDIQNETGHEGVIVDPWGLGIPKSSSKKGRCFIQSLSGHQQRGY
ncbi:MAG: choice-of-anchor U domain-containing protein [bacterium]